jgi:uncharacterized protein (TIRG00374 family)
MSCQGFFGVASLLRRFGGGRGNARTLAGVATALLAAGVLWHHVSHADLSHAGALVREVGFWGLFLLVPVALATLADALGWYLCIPGGRSNVRIRNLYLIRWGTDALSNALPAGAVAAEPMRPFLLHKSTGLPLSDAIASCVIMKAGIAIAQAVFFLMVGLFIVRAEGTIAYLAAGLFVAGFGAGLMILPRYVRLSALFNRLGSRGAGRSQTLLLRVAPYLAKIEHAIGEFTGNHPRRLLGALAVFFGGWIALASEAYLILKLVGADLSFGPALAFEMMASLIRMGFFFIPGGVGVQELGVVGVMDMVGVSETLTLAAAYVMLKRARELCWVVPGLLALGRFRALRGGGISTISWRKIHH